VETGAVVGTWNIEKNIYVEQDD
uniref:Uncharacterized protein n=1 Tax=Caenorhabditis japonica TaxID=281687 RepID=A0A8R1EUG8_CAEJA